MEHTFDRKEPWGDGETYPALYVHRALALVSMAVRSAEGAAAVRKQTGGNAPELVQGILDDVEALRRENACALPELLDLAQEAVDNLDARDMTKER